MLHLQETLCLVYRYLAFLCKGEFDSSCIWPWHVFFHKTRSARTFYDRARTLCLLNCANPCTYPRFVTFSLPRLLVVWYFDDGTFWSPLVCALAYSPQSLCTLVPVWEEKLAKARLGSLDLKDSSHTRLWASLQGTLPSTSGANAYTIFWTIPHGIVWYETHHWNPSFYGIGNGPLLSSLRL